MRSAKFSATPLGCLTGAALLAASLAGGAPAQAAMDSLSTRSSFRVGDSGVVCTAQYRSSDPRLKTMFDRAYRVTCRDAAAPVADALVLRTDRSTDTVAIASGMVAGFACEAAPEEDLPEAGRVNVLRCTNPADGIVHLRYWAQRGDQLFLASTLAGYASAARLALAGLTVDRPVPGKVEVATTAAGNNAAFARVRAGSLDEASARAQAYELNVSGSFSDADAYFETLGRREQASPSRAAEFVANQGLQQSDLGNFPAASALFDRASRIVPRSDGVTQRLIRNYRAIDLLNQGLGPEALSALEAPVAAPDEGMADSGIGMGTISAQLAEEINRETAAMRQFGSAASGLTEQERAVLLDAQAEQLRGTAYRLSGDPAKAKAAIRSALGQYDSVRSGKVTSLVPHRVQADHDLALIAEAEGDTARARALLQDALAILARTYPQTPAPIFAKGWLAGLEARTGKGEEALALYRQIVEESEAIPGSRETIKDLLPGYFELLGNRLASEPDAGKELYRAAQLLQRPGVAQTQAVLARELSSGNDEAAALFRLSLAHSRTIARTSADIAELSAAGTAAPESAQRLAEARQQLEALQREQTELQSRLAEFPQYRSLSSGRLALEELQKLLAPGEAYFKVSLVGEGAYAQLVGPDYLRSFRIDSDRGKLERLVSSIRSSISVEENGRRVTYPFDIESARALFVALFGPVADDLRRVTHLIYEPDGPLLQLPPTLLPVDQASVDSYLARSDKPNADPYDFRGVHWLGRDTSVSVSVSQRSFADVRNIAASRATKAYLGLGENAVPAPRFQRAVATGTLNDGCDWPLSTWRNPISARELLLGKRIFAGGGSAVLTGAAFTDTAMLGRQDLNDYRVIHFATHGLVTAPRRNCPSRPALITSFGPPQKSDGLLTFAEIFDLRLDADLVILSACDTAGAATVSATREAGVETGGDYALDGLVRAFTGAGVRSVLASHWPVPDDFNATGQLINGLFDRTGATTISDALRKAALPLMDQAQTSHPYYWGAFILVGDGAKPLR